MIENYFKINGQDLVILCQIKNFDFILFNQKYIFRLFKKNLITDINNEKIKMSTKNIILIGFIKHMCLFYNSLCERLSNLNFINYLNLK